MSAFVVSKAHIDAMIRRGLALAHSGPLFWYAKGFRDMQSLGYEEMQKLTRTLTDDTADAVGQMLIDECVKSVSYRYQDDKLTNLPGPTNAYWLIPYQYQMSWGARMPNPVEALKLLSCYEYQSCEHPEWHDSEAKRFCESLRHHMIAMLPGYDEALWEWREPSEALAPTPPDPEGRMKTPYDFPLPKTEIDMAEVRSMAPTPPEGGTTMLKREDFNVLANSRGYKIEYKDKFIGGAGLLREAKGPHGSAYMKQVEDYLNAGEEEVDKILAGEGSPSYMIAIAEIDSGAEPPTPPGGKLPTSSPGTWPYTTESAAEAAATRARKRGYIAEVTPPEGEEGQYVVTITESEEKPKPVCRFCEHLVDVRPPRTRHYIGACEYGLRPDTCGKYELAKCFEGHEPQRGYTEESPTPPALSEDEKAIPGFGEKFERCVLDTKAKGGAINPYAVCRSALRRSHSLPVGSKN